MKRPLYVEKIDDLLRSSPGLAGGFLGDDRRPVAEIVESDAVELARLGYACRDVAERMRQIAGLAAGGLGSWVKIGRNTEAAMTDTRGVISCPWPHAGVFPKTAVTVRQTDEGRAITWSALNVHLIGEHGFFEGHGSPYRLDPDRLVAIIFC